MKKSFFLKILSLALAVTFMISCEKEPQVQKEVKPEIDNTVYEGVTLSGDVKETKINYMGMEFTALENEDYYLIEGDILIDKKEFNSKKGAVVSGRGWPNGIVYYSVSSNLPNKERVTQAIAHIEAKTGIDFRRRTNQRNYIQVVYSSNGTYSSGVGRLGGRQRIGLANWATTGNTIHEFGHALGLFHEHTRDDRDNYIVVNFNNIDPGWHSQYRKYSNRYRGYDYGSFDFNSIMLYSSNNRYNGGWSMVRRDNGQPFRGQRDGLSRTDIGAINSTF